ncbi:MAG TPA: hypothetical protein VMB79_06805 [Jatrophihabitans sp.]|nr:hypothetical protein [Jatrophihabitans sp.]
MLDAAVSAAWLVTGPHQLRSNLQRPAAWQARLIECPTAIFLPPVDGGQTYTLALAGAPAGRSVLLDQDGVPASAEPCSPASGLADPGTVALGLLRPAGDGAVRVYAHVDTYHGHLRFLELPGGPVPAGQAVTALLAGIDEHFLKVNNYLCFRVKLQPDVELEHKFTLTGNPDVCVLARQSLAAAGAGELPGWIVEFREEIQQWDFLNHVYAIEEPAEDAGYVSFIPTTDGRYTVKRKIFTADTDERPELRSRGVEVGADLAAHLRDSLGLTPAWHASFRRIRYDVSVESIATGNVFGLAFDRSTIIDEDGRPAAGAPELVQCEIEYIYSQTLGTATYDSVRADLAELRVLVGHFFDRNGIENYQTHESKLTFLRNQHAGAR